MKAPLSPAIGGGWTRPHPSVLRDRPHWVYRLYDEDDVLLYVGATYLPPPDRFPSLKQWHNKTEIDKWHRWEAHLYPSMDQAHAAEGMWVDIADPPQNGMRTGVAARQRVNGIGDPIDEASGLIREPKETFSVEAGLGAQRSTS